MDDATAPAHRARRRVPRARWWVLALVLLLAVWAAAVALLAVRADRLLRAGTAAAQRARSELGTSDLTASPAAGDLRVAADDFRAAHADVSGPLLTPLGILPVVGTQVHSLQDLSGAAAAVTAGGASTLDVARSLLLAPHHTPAERVAVATRLAAAVAGLDRTVAGVDLGPSRGLLLTLARKRDTFAADLVKVRTALTKADGASAALASILRGPDTLLVAATNNAEMRDGSGMILQVGPLSISDGHFRLGAVESVGSLLRPDSTLPVPVGLARVWGFLHPATDFRILRLSPQIPANDRLAAAMWADRTGQHVDGVLSVDVGALADLLAVTGPVTVGTTTYTAGNVDQALLVQQYVGLSGDAANEARREQLGLLARAVVARLQQGGYSMSALVSALDRAVDGRHLTMWSADPAVEADWVQAGAAGTVGGDDLLLGLLNLGADKLDPYQQLRAVVTTAPDGASTAVTVRVTDTNATPSSVSGYAAGGGPTLGPPRTYTGAVSLSLPVDASRVHATRGTVLTGGTDGLSDQLAMTVRIPDGASTTVTFHFTLPGRSGRFTVLPSARLPPTPWQGPTTSFTDATAHTLPW